MKISIFEIGITQNEVGEGFGDGDCVAENKGWGDGIRGGNGDGSMDCSGWGWGDGNGYGDRDGRGFGDDYIINGGTSKV